MCGIYSIINYNKETTYYDSFMKTKHRGPDSSTFKLVDDKVILGFHRLAINGLGESGDQPFHSDGVYVICNGEIYNYMELEQDLLNTFGIHYMGYDKNNTSDCRIILSLYLHYGIEHTCKALKGEWSFIIYDTREETRGVYAARDFLGKRPLYIGHNSNDSDVGFASEAMSLTDQFGEINQFEPGYYYHSVPGTGINDTIVKKWFNYDTMMNVGETSEYYKNMIEEDVIVRIRDLVRTSVHTQVTMSDVDVGCYLSGGLDSSLMTALAVEKLGSKMHTFTIGLKGSVDIIAAKKVAKFLGIEENHHVVIVTIEQVIEAIPEAVKYGSTYDVTTIRCLVYQYLLSKYVKTHTNVKVLITGEGADEMCPGYFEFHDQFKRTDQEFKDHSQIRMEQIHQFDGLRSDRAAAANGLEVRMPLLTKDLAELFHNINPNYRRFGTGDRMEKYLLRLAFAKDKLLPDKILWRRKHAFSDAINSIKCEKPSHQLIEEYAKKLIIDANLKSYGLKDMINNDSDRGLFNVFPVNKPTSFEGYWYRWLYESKCKYKPYMIDNMWLPDIPNINVNDPSATLLPGFKIDDIVEDEV
jgi:asparagine synthase (glutamine-hydrolysing)